MGWRTTRTVTVAALVVALGVSSAGCSAVSSSAGSCAAKEIRLGDSDLRPGGQVTLSVDWMWQTCEDTGGTPRASDDVAVTITPASTGRAVVLGRPTPEGSRFRVAGRFELPDDLPSGDAVLGVHSTVGDRAGADVPVTIAATG
ncbi:hypothetical protein JOE58_001639 [Curtobacterium luteum]|uniref:Bacterial spore germination immunoglobulin-like domain-containing protein n=1 Tax=Curtobacterium luteum TaxID=33881 RepID=A0ABS2RUH7_9MICO|nr:hypothetical protein [Curtobacterium luteum]MBM7802388.1 hypothetical protein [Curtobacterium luteum]NUU50546.1 hypothetical protein [Curtobacterium luteum]